MGGGIGARVVENDRVVEEDRINWGDSDSEEEVE